MADFGRIRNIAGTLVTQAGVLLLCLYSMRHDGLLQQSLWHFGPGVVLLLFPYVLSNSAIHVTAFNHPAVLLEIIRDGNHDAILEAIASHRRRIIRARFAQFDPQGEPNEEIAKFRNLRDADYISESEMQVAIEQIRDNSCRQAEKKSDKSQGELLN